MAGYVMYLEFKDRKGVICLEGIFLISNARCGGFTTVLDFFISRVNKAHT